MVQSIPARRVKLSDLKDMFGLQWNEAEDFFTEWFGGFPELTTEDLKALDRVKANYRYLLEYPIMESIVKMVVLSPLLDIAGFYAPPYRVTGETDVKVSAVDEGEVSQGSIDVLVIQKQFWVTVIEAKNSEFSLTKAIPQTLAYMLAEPQSSSPTFGMVTNGSEFLFLKITHDTPPEYGTSDVFSMWNRGNNLYSVVQILKHFGQLIA
ncbi:type I restriction endonuclease [Leptothoe spongobia]|uniref:Restriction endonuclease subunit R n=1 Tax=Leptothoe spongobia TAU-MAC 1115 TaxID=1967444 RepID=A0A947GRJ6_9CYAN|nr:type I restriction endonuclease [Leptothoe spongobia]MBT9317516.1 restriction endonuclease subunit R [Leptothoe spongobia TAU-MAC 1115]